MFVVKDVINIEIEIDKNFIQMVNSMNGPSVKLGSLRKIYERYHKLSNSISKWTNRSALTTQSVKTDT